MQDKSIPIYVTRKNNDGEVGTWFVEAHFGVLVLILVALNALGWSIYGIVELISKVVDAV